MKLKRMAVLFILSLVLLVSANAAYADTYYDITYSTFLDPYGYGCDWTGSLAAYESPDGSFTNVSGIKIRDKVYRNGVKIVDTSKTDTTNPFSVELTGSEVSDNYSNTWQLIHYLYVKDLGDTSYMYEGSATVNESN